MFQKNKDLNFEVLLFGQEMPNSRESTLLCRDQRHLPLKYFQPAEPNQGK